MSHLNLEIVYILLKEVYLHIMNGFQVINIKLLQTKHLHLRLNLCESHSTSFPSRPRPFGPLTKDTGHGAVFLLRGHNSTHS